MSKISQKLNKIGRPPVTTYLRENRSAKNI